MKERPYNGILWVPPFETFSRLMEDLREKPFKTYRKRQVPRFLKIECPETWVPLTFAISYNPHGRFYNMKMSFAPFGEPRYFMTSFHEDQVSKAHDTLRSMIAGEWVEYIENIEDRLSAIRKATFRTLAQERK